MPGAYEPEPAAFDVASCIGATWIGGGIAGTIELLRPALRAGRAAADRRAVLDRAAAGRGGRGARVRPGRDFVSLVGTLDRLEASGLELVEMVLANPDSWDRYEAAQWRTIAGVAGGEPGRSRPRRDARRSSTTAAGPTSLGPPLPRLGRVRHPPR